MATGTIENGIKIAKLTKDVTAYNSTTAMGGNYAYINLSNELTTMLGANWRDRVIAVIPCGGTSTGTEVGIGGLVTPYLQSGNNNTQFALASPSPGGYRCDFEVFYR